jgi:hypothetical protein
MPIENCNFASFLFYRKARQEKKHKGHKEKKMIAENENGNKTISLTIKVNRQINLFA